jgi:2Fe-2S ferredoxin
MGVDLDHYCGGQCACGTCRVEILEGAQNLSAQDGMEQMVLGSTHVAAGNRLACQARLLGPVRVRIPEWF